MQVKWTRRSGARERGAVEEGRDTTEEGGWGVQNRPAVHFQTGQSVRLMKNE